MDPSEAEETAVAGTHVALLRGINVGRSKRIAMADLRSLITDLGYGDVRTLLNSGNVVLSAPGAPAGDISRRIECALSQKRRLSVGVTVLTAAELAQVVHENPLYDSAADPARLLIAVFADPGDLTLLEAHRRRDWSPSVLRIGSRAAYLWCPQGILASPLFDAVDRAVGRAATTRNWTTLAKLNALTANEPAR